MNIETEDLLDKIWLAIRKKVIDNNIQPNVIIIHHSQRYTIQSYMFDVTQNTKFIFGYKLIYATNIEENEILIY